VREPPTLPETGVSEALTFGKAVIGSGGKVRVRARCKTRQVSRCRGTLSASLIDATQSAGAQSVRFGTVHFSIASPGRRTIEAALSRSDATTVARLSKRQLASRRLRVTARITVGGGVVRQTALLRVMRWG
jgi:hypothetical protein